MRFSPRALTASVTGALAFALVIAACTDADNPLLPQPPEELPANLIAIRCEASVPNRTVRCGDNAEGMAGGANRLIIGGQNVNLKLTSTSPVVTNVAPDSLDFTFDVTVQNLIRQPFGTEDTTTYAADPRGVKVFFHQGPTPNVGTIYVQNPASDDSTFTASNQPFFQYNQVLWRSQVSAPQTWVLRMTDNVTSFTFLLYVSTPVPYPQGWTDAVQDTAPSPVGRLVVDTILPGDSVQLAGVPRNRTGGPVAGAVTFTSSNPAAATVSGTGMVKGVAAGVTTVTGTSPGKPSFRRTQFVVNTPSLLARDSASALENVTRNVAAPGVLANDSDSDGPLTAIADTVATVNGGIAIISTDGSFTYLTAPGVAAADSFRYHATDGVVEDSAWVKMRVEASKLWYVQGGAVAGDGRDRFPFATFAAAQAVAAADDSILVKASGTAIDEAVALDDAMTVLGARPAVTLTRTLADAAVVTILAPGTSPTLTRGTAGTTLTLGQNNTVRGLVITSSNGAGIARTTFGTFTASELSVNAAGPALNLSTGTLAAQFDLLTSSGSATTGLSLTSVAGSMTVNAGTISGSAQTAVAVSGGTVGFSYPGNVSQANNFALVSVTNHATGTIGFATGTLNASNGTGLQFDAATGTYNFTGTTTLNGGDAGIDLVNGSNGTFSFAASSSITNGTGNGLHVLNSQPASLTYAGTISTSTGRPVVVDAASPCGTITVSGNVSSTGQGILVQDCTAGTVTFSGGSKTLNTGANQGVTLTNNTGGTILFSGGGLAITTTSAIGFGATTGGTVSVTGANNTVASGTGVAVSINGVGTGASGMTLRSVSNSGASNGILLVNVAGSGLQVTGDGATNGTGGTITNHTGHGVSLTTVAGTVGLSFMNVTAAASGGNAGIFGSSFGTLTADNVTVSTTGGPALNLTTGALSGDFNSLTSAGSTGNAVSLTGVTSAATVALGGGSLGTAAGTTFNVSGGSVSTTYTGNVTQATAAAALLVVTGDHTGTLNFSTGTVSASNGTGLQFTNADGAYNFTGTLTLAGGDAGIDIAAGSTGTVDVNPSGSAAITSPTGIAIAVVGGSADLTYRGNVTQANNAALLSVSGGHSGDLSFPTGTLSATNGSGLQFDNADGTYAFAGSTVTLNGGDAGIDVTSGSGGTFTFPSTATITSPNAGNLVTISSSAPNFTYSGAFTKANNNVSGIVASNNTGGSITFNGSGVTKSISSGNAAAVNLSTNGATSILFSGGGLVITSGSGAGLTATGSGTLQVTGSNNTIGSGSGIALNVQNVTIGASGLSFLSISHSGGANGIFLQNTGSTNGLQVTGDGSTNGSGGTITNTTGGDGATSGNGVYLDNARNVNLSFMALSGHANNGLLGTSVTHLTINKLRFTGNNGTSPSGSFEESAVHLVNSGGAIKITNSRLDGGAWNGFTHRNSSAVTVDSLVLVSDTVNTLQGSLVDGRNDGLQAMFYAGTADVRMRSNVVTFWWGNAIQVVAEDASAVTARLQNNTVNQTSGAAAGAGGIHVTGGNLQYLISGNSVNGANGAAISADKQDFTTHMRGTITGNFVGTSGVNNSGSGTGIGIFASHIGPNVTTVAITNNTIRQINGSANGAITTLTGDDVGGGGAGTMNATITGNNIQESGTVVNSAQHGILVTHGRVTNDSDQGCYDIGGSGGLANSITNFNTAAGGVNVNRIRINERFVTTARFPGYTGANNDNNAMTTYLMTRNTFSNGAHANNVSAGGPGFLNTVPAGSACTQPPAL